MILHQKIQELRNSVGHEPIHYFYPSRAAIEKKPMEVRLAHVSEENPRLIKQYFCIFGVADDRGTVPMKGSFKKSIEERGPNSKSTYKITVLNQHDQREPLCLPSVLREDEIGLYAEYTPDEGIQANDNLVLRVKRGTINNGSYGFHYVWDKMEYDEKKDVIYMYEQELFEVSPVTIGSQQGTFVVRAANGLMIDEFLEEDTENIIKQVPRKHQLELRTVINRHISLAKSQPLEETRKALDEDKPKQVGLDLDYIVSKLNF